MAMNKTNPEEIFNKAIEISDLAKRTEYLDRACSGDEKLRAEVEFLIKSHQQAGSFLESPLINSEITLNETPLIEGPGTVIGRYKLLEKIGEGGMASVYMAEQKQPIRRRVALKIIKLGMDTKQVIARFEAERQVLAMMDHPNIAQVFDAGTTETGRPYFVMELVRGVPITEFCDKNHLNMQERLELFISVCNAVQHAHQKGIIHRDIKPTNIMVTLHDGKPVVKVIDFGIAKAVNQQLTEKTVFTRYSQMIGTPEYMSPEQAEMSGLDIDTRTDVFSLGVLLYELMTGTTPFDSEYLLKKGYGEMQRIIREEEPLRPSTKVSTLGDTLTVVAKHRHTSPEILRRLIQSDLDWIVMKTLEKDRQRRYESVSELAADIKRHLKHEPVLAGRPSRIYKIQKFYKRNKTLCIFSAAIAVIVVLAAVIASHQAWVAQKARKAESIARKVAEKDRDRAQQAEEAERKQRNEADTAKEEAVKHKTIAESERDQAEKAKHLAEEETERAIKAQDLAERLAYKGTVQTVQTKIESKNYTNMRELLFGTEINRRGWEWGYLANSCQIPDWEESYGGRSLCASPDGKHGGLGTSSGLFIGDLNTGQVLRQYKLNVGFSCYYDPQGHFIAALSIVSGLYSLYSGNIVKLDINSDKILLTSETSDYSSFCISPDGEYIYGGTNSGKIHKLKSSDWTIDIERVLSKQDKVININIDENGEFLGVLCENGKLYLYKASTLELIAEKGQLSKKESAQHTDILISNSLGKIIVIWFGSLYTNTLDPNDNDLRSWQFAQKNGYALAFNKDHTRLALAEFEGYIHIIDTNNMQNLYTIYHDKQVNDVYYLPDGTIISAGGNSLKCWSHFGLLNETPKKTIEFPKDKVAWNLDYRSDGGVIAFNVWNYNGLFLYDTGKKEYKELIVEGIEKDLENYGRPVTLFRPGTTQLIVEANDILHVFDTGTDGNPEINQIVPSHTVIHAAFSPNGKYLALSYEDGIIGLIDFEKGMSSERVFHESGQQNSFVNISVNGVLAAMEKGAMEKSAGGIIFLWDIYTGELLRTMNRSSRYLWEYWEIQGVAFDPSGRYLAFGNINGIIEIWDTHTGKLFKNLTGHLTNLVSNVQFSQDGSRLLSAGRDGTVRIWDWRLGQELLVLNTDYKLSDVQFSPNELYICTTGYETSIGCTIQAAPWRLDARGLQPANKGIVNITDTSKLSWLAGMNATNHDVYFGESENSVRKATTESTEYKGSFKLGTESYKLDKLKANTTYFWRIDEVNNAKPDVVWKGDVWSFSTISNVIIDDFEGYDNSDSITIHSTWHDGRENDENGSRIGYETAPFFEEKIIQNGKHSAPLFYDNSGTMDYSEAVRTFESPQNWTGNGSDSLRLYYRGQAIKSFKEISPGVIAMSGEGTDIWENKDDFHFAYKQLSGDGSIVARVDSLESYQQYTKTGVMIRSTLEPTSIHVISDIHSNGRTALQYREKWGDITKEIKSGTEGVNLPVWLKISREGNTFTSERSIDGVQWEPVNGSTKPATVDIFMNNPIYIGLAVCSSMANKTSAATFSGVEITGNVSSDWQLANIGDEIQPEGMNTFDKLYVALEDSDGHRQSVYAPETAVVISKWVEWIIPYHQFNGTAVVISKWVEWIIPYHQFNGVDMSSIKKIAIGVGDPDNPLKGKGMIYIDNISYGSGLKGYQYTPE